MQLCNLPFDLPTDEEKALISKDVQVDSDKLKHGINLFRQWLKCENYLPNDVDEVLIRNFLYGCKGNLEIAKGKFEKYMVNRTKMTQLFHDRIVRDEITLPFGLHRMVCVMPKLTPQGYRVILLRLPSSDSTHFNCTDAFKHVLLHYDVHLFNDENSGYEFIYDTENFSVGLFAKLNLTLSLHMMQIMYNILPFRLKSIHVVNVTSSMEIILNMMMKIVSKKLADRVRHTKAEDLSKFIPTECLPNEYGGIGGDIEEIFARYNIFLKRNSKWVKDSEGLQLTGPIPENKQDLYSFEDCSMDGSFRKLNID